MYKKKFAQLGGLLSLIMYSVNIVAQPLNPPFVSKVAMTVIDPETFSPELTNIDGFSQLAKSADGKLFATLKADSVRWGILVCNGKTLEINSVHWLDEIEGKPGFEWCGLLSLGETGMAALCCEQQTGQESTRRHGYLVRYLPDQSEYWQIQDINVPEIPVALAYLPCANAIAGLTKPSNWFFIYDLEKAEFEVHQVLFDFVPFTYPHGRVLHYSPQGNLYGSYKGRLFCYHTNDTFFEYLGMLPCEYGHLSEVALTAMADNGKGLLVGGTSGDGYLFTVNTETREVNSWGKPTDGTEIRALVYTDSSGFWGIAAVPKQSCRLFHFKPEQHSLKDMGIPAGLLKKDGRTWTWHAFDISDMLVLDDGRILLAESARQAKLLVFDPRL